MKKIGLIVIVFMILFFGYKGYEYLDFRSKNAVSDAGFVKSDSLSVLNFKVGGKIDSLLYKEGDRIKKGSLLASIDAKDFVVASKKAKNSIISLQNKIDSLKVKKEKVAKDINISNIMTKNDINAYKSKIISLKLSIKSNQTKIKQLQKDTFRLKKLSFKKLVAKDKYEKSATALKSLKEKLLAQKEELNAAKFKLQNIKEKLNLIKNSKLNLQEIEKNIQALTFQKKALAETLKELKLKISYCKLFAPFDGVIAKKFVNDQRVVARGYPIYALVDPRDLHAEVLLSEKKLHGVKVGNKVEVDADAIKDKKFEGAVETILPASASTFSLVPRDIASGEFTKLDQRFVVRIKLKEIKGLRVGMSLNVAIKRGKGEEE